MISANFLTLLLACLEAMEPISLILVLSEMFTVLKEFDMFSSPVMNLKYYLLLGSLTCLGVTEISFVLKSY